MISGKEAAQAFINGEQVEFLDKTGQWRTIFDNTVLRVFRDHDDFRLKPRTITINGIEVPAPFDPKEGDEFWILFESHYSPCGYKLVLPDDQYSELCYGAWRTEEEVKQVVATLRSIFNPQ